MHAGTGPRVLFFQQSPVTQATQQATRLQGIKLGKIPAGRVIHHPGFARINQRLGLFASEPIARQRLEPQT